LLSILKNDIIAIVGDDMRKKKIPNASKKRLAIFGTISVIIIFYFIFLFGNYIYNIYELKQEQKILEKNYNSLKETEKELRNEIEKLQDEDYIARYAREKYSYSKDGEYILKLNDEEKNNEIEESKLNIDYNYFIYAGGIILLIIIFHTIKKKK